MSAESSVPDVLNQLERLNQLLDEQVRWTSAQSFSGSDEAGGVDVTLDGQLKLVGLEIEDGLLRLGAEAVEQRINQALLNARTSAADGISSQQTQFMDSLFDVTREMAQSVDAQLAKAEQMGLLPNQPD
ncbi:MAG: YbaB/EbfC family nucleoid-associated protein [Mycobacteriaceae bacterium]